jgi:hypothetical protein
MYNSRFTMDEYRLSDVISGDDGGTTEAFTLLPLAATQANPVIPRLSALYNNVLWGSNAV